MPTLDPTNYLQTLAAILAERDVQGWLVGGTVRDMLKGQAPLDYDIAVDADGLPLARALADRSGAAFVTLDAARGVGRVVAGVDGPQRLSFDLVQLRAPDIIGDLRLRDFSINAMALPLVKALDPANADLARHVIDPCGGAEDLAAGLLRASGPQSLPDDPLRVLRAVRLAARLDLRIDPDLDSAISAVGPRLVEVAAERIRDELLGLLALPYAARWLRYLDERRVLTVIFPELEAGRACTQPAAHFLPVLAHMLEAVCCLEWIIAALEDRPVGREDLPAALRRHPDLSRRIPFSAQLADHLRQAMGVGQNRGSFLKLALLLHDVDKPTTREERADGTITFYGHQELGATTARSIGRRLRLSRQAQSYIETVVRQHMRPGQLRGEAETSPRAIARLFRATGEAGPDVLLHELADHMAVRGPELQPAQWQAHLAWTERLLGMYWQAPAAARPALIDGKRLMAELGLEPGRLVGVILAEIEEARAAGEISSREEALALARAIAERQAT